MKEFELDIALKDRALASPAHLTREDTSLNEIMNETAQ